MNMRKLLLITLIVGMLLLSNATSAAPMARPCQAGTTYDPACDVDHDGDVDIFDIQKAAGHWNQSGPWTSDNDHTHLGQVWTGTNNPLVLTGSFGVPTLAPLALSNSLGYGLSIPSAGLSGVAIGTVGTDGVFVNSAANSGLRVASATFQGVSVGSAGIHGVSVESAGVRGVNVDWAGGDGLFVCRTGSAPGCNASPSNNGVEIGNAEDDGLHVGRADDDGVHVQSAGSEGVFVEDAFYTGIRVGSAGNDGFAVDDAFDVGVRVNSAGGVGMQVTSAGDDGVYVHQVGNPSNLITNPDRNGLEIAGAETHGIFVGRADYHGILVQSAGEQGLEIQHAGSDGLHVTGDSDAAVFYGGIAVVGGSCGGCRLVTFAMNVADQPLVLGDVVTLAGLRETEMDSGPVLLEVVPAIVGRPPVGVVTGRATLVVDDDPMPGATGRRLVSGEGPAAPGEYVTVLYGGLAQVRVSADRDAIIAGTRLTASARPGHVGAARTVMVEGVELEERAPALGVALEPLAAGEGLIWVLVNVQ